jgi:hypothetical protein
LQQEQRDKLDKQLQKTGSPFNSQIEVDVGSISSRKETSP